MQDNFVKDSLNTEQERERESSEGNRVQGREQYARQLCEGFLEHGTGEHQSNQVFSADGIARTLQSELEQKNPLKIIEKECP